MPKVSRVTPIRRRVYDVFCPSTSGSGARSHQPRIWTSTACWRCRRRPLSPSHFCPNLSPSINMSWGYRNLHVRMVACGMLTPGPCFLRTSLDLLSPPVIACPVRQAFTTACASSHVPTRKARPGSWQRGLLRAFWVASVNGFISPN